MHYSSLSRLRDVIFFGALLFLLKTAAERTTTFIGDHKKSMIHQLDRTFIDEIYTAQRQLHYVQEHHIDNDEIANALADIKERLCAIEEKYKTNSAGIMILGPIGSAAIVTKEEKLRIKLLDAINDLNRILHVLTDNQHEFRQIDTITDALENNKKLLQKITA
jgi:hypothetical protein